MSDSPPIPRLPFSVVKRSIISAVPITTTPNAQARGVAPCMDIVSATKTTWESPIEI